MLAKNVRNLVMIGFLLLGVMAMSVQAASYFQDFEDFEDETVGAYSGAGGDSATDIGAWLWTYDMRGDIVDSGSTPADPFGGTGNQSLRLHASTAATSVFAYYDLGEIGTAGISFSMNFNLSAPSSDINRAYIQLRDNDADQVFRIRVQSDGNFILDAGDNTGQLILDNTITTGTNYTLVINMNDSTDTFTGTLNGAPLTDVGGTVTSFGYADTGVDMTGGSTLVLGLLNSTTTETPEFFVDNIGVVSSTPSVFLYGDANGDGVVSAADYAAVQSAFGNTYYSTSTATPEPATMSLLGLGGLLLFRNKKRC